MKVSAGSVGHVLWTTTSDTAESMSKALAFTPIVDGQFHLYALDLSGHPQWAGKDIRSLRLDPTDVAGAAMAIDFIQTVPPPAPAAAPPAAPSGLVASAVFHNRVDLRWTDHADDEDGFVVERSTDGSTWVVAADNGSNFVTSTVSGLARATSYWLRVKAVNGQGESASSNVVAVTTAASPVSFQFEAAGDTEGWVKNTHLTSLVVSGGALATSSTGTDPYLRRSGMSFAGNEVPLLAVRMKTSCSAAATTTGQLFWTHSTALSESELRKINFAVTADGQFHDYLIDTAAHGEWAGREIRSLRLDPTVTSGCAIEIDSIATAP
ncbi:MAG: fibronectin type III domain-containing protein [Thermodesulfobacteriota bacterium]